MRLLRHFGLPAILAISAGAAPLRAGETRTIPLKSLESKIRGGWAGQMIGVAYGGPTEFRWLGKTIEGEIEWDPAAIIAAYHQDDLYVEMTFAETMDKLGLDATAEQFGEFFKGTKYPLWHANAGARRNLNRGIKAPASGRPEHNIHANDIDFQIEADFIGLMCPGLPRESNKYCDRAGRVMNSGDGLYGGMFVCGAYAEAFFTEDPVKAVEAGLACIPPESGYAGAIRDTISAWRKHPEDWRAAWREVNAVWDKNDPCLDGAMGPFNIDARLNGAYIAMGLLYGGGDFAKTMEITTRCGQDSDCNPSNAAGILGVILGYEKLPEDWRSAIARTLEEKFIHTSFTYEGIVASTMKRAIKAAEAAGGKVEGDNLEIPLQTPAPPALEQWNPGVPARAHSTLTDDWVFKGDWMRVRAGDRFIGLASENAGAVAELEFEGTGIAVAGIMDQRSGKAAVTLDGEEKGELDGYIVENTTDRDMWRAFGLKPGRHRLTIRIKGEADPRSSGKLVILEGAISYK